MAGLPETLLEVPGIVGRTEEPGFRRSGKAEFRSMGFAENDETGPLQTHDHLGVRRARD
jgi:hypothetical protein